MQSHLVAIIVFFVVKYFGQYFYLFLWKIFINKHMSLQMVFFLVAIIYIYNINFNTLKIDETMPHPIISIVIFLFVVFLFLM